MGRPASTRGTATALIFAGKGGRRHIEAGRSARNLDRLALPHPRNGEGKPGAFRAGTEFQAYAGWQAGPIGSKLL
jgi:hypothetical protein